MTNDCIEYRHLCYPRFEDMDAYGILHHSRYLLLVEEAKFAFMNNPAYFGLDILEEESKFLISNLNMSYKNALRYKVGVPAVIVLRFRIEGEIKVIFDFDVYYEDKLVCAGSATHVTTNQKGALQLNLPLGLVEKYKELKGISL